MKAGPFLLFVLGVALMALLPAILAVSIPRGPSHYCPLQDEPEYHFQVPAQQTMLAYEPPLEFGPFQYSWITIWLNSTASDVIFLLNDSQFSNYNSTLPPPGVGTTFSTPPAIYSWSSGPVSFTNTTLNFPPTSLVWWLLVEDPGSAATGVYVIVSICMHPS